VSVSSEPHETPWWLSLDIDIDAPVVWNVIQELAYVCNGLSLTATVPVVFKPESPPPYLNGGPRDYLSWRIDALTADASPDAERQLDLPNDDNYIAPSGPRARTRNMAG